VKELSKIEETMLGPLWARATYSQKYPELLEDQKAIEIMERVDYDFSQIREYLGEWRAVGLMIRAKRFDEAAKKYIGKHPFTTIINIGAGLDTTFSRIDNGKIKMYNLDLPGAIEFRNSLIPNSERNKNIATSAFNYKWIQKIDYKMKKGIFFIAGGFIYYFNEKKVSKLIAKLADQFPGGEIVFDTVSSLAMKIVNKRAEKAESELRFQMAMNNPYEVIPQWSEKLEIKECFVLGDHVSTRKNWKLKTKIMNKITNWLKTARIIQLRFLE
jgi:O-methyltransferase involved in polyketide biosynthesis